MKKVIILIAMVIMLAAANTFAACSIKELQTGAACSVTKKLDILPDKPTNTNKLIPNPNKNKFEAEKENSPTVRNLGTIPPVENNSTAGPYNSNCQFGVCPPKINNHQFDK